MTKRKDSAVKPNRLLLIIHDQWDDDESVCISGDSDFKRLVILLKSWGVPFDIVRLDQEIPTIFTFLDRHYRPMYDTIIWLADVDADYRFEWLSSFKAIVAEKGIGFVALGNTIAHPAIQEILGLRSYGLVGVSAPLEVTDAMPGVLGSSWRELLEQEGDPGGYPAASMPYCQPETAVVLATCADYPRVTCNRLADGSLASWMHVDSHAAFEDPLDRRILQELLTHTKGYLVCRDWGSVALLRMDDPGASQSSYLERWHYPTLSCGQIRTTILNPLLEHGAFLTVFVVPAFVDLARGVIAPSWSQEHVDRFGVRQDYASTKAGLLEGLEKGILDIQCHGWSHMQHDLESAPGPIWRNEQQYLREEWYREFFDGLRNKEVPASVQFRRMSLGRKWIQEEFGVLPIALVPPGSAISRGPATSTAKIAGRAGFGWCEGYVGREFVVSGWHFEGSADVPALTPVPPDGHDRGLVHEPHALAGHLLKHRHGSFHSYTYYVAHLHHELTASLTEGALHLFVRWDPDFTLRPQENRLRFGLRLAPSFIQKHGLRFARFYSCVMNREPEPVAEIEIPLVAASTATCQLTTG